MVGPTGNEFNYGWIYRQQVYGKTASNDDEQAVRSGKPRKQMLETQLDSFHAGEDAGSG